MKRYLYILAAVPVLLSAGFFWVRHKADETRARMSAEIQRLQDEKRAASKNEEDKVPIDLFTLHAGDTVLVAACTKSFYISNQGVADVHAGSTVPAKFLSIGRSGDGRFELEFSCESIKNAIDIHPIIITTPKGQDLTVYFIPASNLDGQLNFYSNFEIR